MEEASIIGIDLAKQSFQLHGARADGSVPYQKKPSRGSAGFSCLAGGVCGGDGSLRQCPLLGPGHHDARSQGEAGSADLREAVRQEAEDRSGRRDLRSGAASDHALHDGQDRSAFTNWLRGPSGLWPRPSGSMRRDSSQHRQCHHEPSPRPGRAGQSQGQSSSAWHLRSVSASLRTMFSRTCDSTSPRPTEVRPPSEAGKRSKRN